MSYESSYSKQRQRKRKKHRTLKGFFLSMLLIGCCIVVIWFVKEYGTYLFNWEDTPTFSKSFDNASCPESLLEMAEKNPETIEFVENYANEKDKEHIIDLTSEVQKGQIPLFLQWDKRWGYERYGNDVIAVTGCGPTCLSMVICGLSGDTKWSPLKVAQMAEEQGYYVNGVGSSWNLMSEGAKELGLTVHKVRFEESAIQQTLRNHQPIICIMGPGDFTTTGHFIVLSGLEQDGKVKICDPFRRKNSKAWELDKIMGQIRELWAYSYE